MNAHDTQQKQQETFERYKAERPELVLSKKQQSEESTFAEIGMWHMPENRTRGHLRLYPEDFIVEERTLNDDIFDISFDETVALNTQKESGQKTLYAKLTKIGIPTAAAAQRIAEAFDIPEKTIGTAGLKDADAITAQKISFSKSQYTPEDFSGGEIPKVFLTDFSYDKGALHRGDLHSNVFTITVRTENSLDQNALHASLEHIQKNGILNYYQAQRFGGLRLMSHVFGKLMCQGFHSAAMKKFLFAPSEYGIPLISELRARARDAAPDWQKVEEIFSELPYTLTNELRAVHYLKKNPDNYTGALYAIKDQVTLWVYAYASLLFNKYISEHADTVDGSVPLLLSNDPEKMSLYEKYLHEDGTKNLRANLEDFSFISFRSPTADAKIYPANVSSKVFDGGVVVTFELPKGAYATTFLSNLFSLSQDTPIPQWVNRDRIDPKILLGGQSLQKLQNYFGEDYYYKDEHKEYPL